ncbi:hypothetical protein KP79_PYT17808 [Mizuhopecten yessoensis]|uniref:Uncharacterized protein n=1 Tax=Mizuhopecten yessoensis TaxID=6573 RepID=A0A210PJ29_MIZYE|nr:hypothetical protein KP79_PYT17808 [Mizuhopecten yessoensis]
MNTKKLTSNVDVYATLLDILELGRGHKSPRVSGKYGTSFFRDISTKRTWDDLKIQDIYCACASFVETNFTDSAIIDSISKWVVDEINTVLLNVSHLCIELRLGKINKAWRSVNNKALEAGEEDVKHSSKKDFIIQFNVSPSYAEFEATVRYFASENKFMILGIILRTNAFKGQSDCVSHLKNGVVLERYCFCH